MWGAVASAAKRQAAAAARQCADGGTSGSGTTSTSIGGCSSSGVLARLWIAASATSSVAGPFCGQPAVASAAAAESAAAGAASPAALGVYAATGAAAAATADAGAGSETSRCRAVGLNGDKRLLGSVTTDARCMGAATAPATGAANGPAFLTRHTASFMSTAAAAAAAAAASTSAAAPAAASAATAAGPGARVPRSAVPSDPTQSQEAIALARQYLNPALMSSAERQKLQLKGVRESFRQHDGDCGSSEVQIAMLTHRIRHMGQHLTSHHKDNHSRRGLEGMLARRRKLLKYLRRKDWDSYCQVILRLGLRDRVDLKT